MATFEYKLSTKANNNGRQEILIRLYHGKKIDLRVKSNIFVYQSLFEYYIDKAACRKLGIVVSDDITTATEKEAIKAGYILKDKGTIGELSLKKYRNETPEVKHQRKQKSLFEKLIKQIEDAFEELKSSTNITKEWLEEQVDRFHDPQKYVEVKPEDLLPKTLLEALENYIQQAPTRILEGRKHNSGKPISERSLLQHKNTQKRVKEYLEYRGAPDIALDELGKEFYDDFVNYLCDEQQNVEGIAYAKNTIGRHIKAIKSMINILPTSAKINCEFVAPKKCSVLAEDINNIALSEAELKLLAEYPFKGHLACIRDEFIIMAWTGCRYSDLGKLTKGNIIDLTNGKAFSIRQQKTGADVVIPIMPEIEGILAKYDYQLRKPIANQVFNRFLKDMAKEAGLIDIVKIKRTVGGKEIIHELEKWECVSAHTARRSFATNMYKRKFPTLAIMQLTGHTTETSFLKYIKVSKEENAELMLEAVKAWSANQQKGEVEK